ncbi:hypothetical protein [Pseudomonas sp. OV226]|uniref:hypothetical protein n=1 Tax=Pseudomonas sp. OV226 TaxID=2135588 RepID=UPI000D6B11B5|nr:hypothetical protein [Pseudomonas sp. OV226]PWK45992.1 hypothetical protein C7534_101593 [Pseudomonas sp. OV226]
MRLIKVFIRLVTPCVFVLLTASSTLCFAEKPIPKALVAESFDNFRAPDTVLKAGPEAEEYCKKMNDKTRLPTVLELQELFTSKTKSPAAYPDPSVVENDDMSTVHGWPLNHLCGGSNGFYLAQDEDESEYYVVSLTTGLTILTNSDYVGVDVE